MVELSKVIKASFYRNFPVIRRLYFMLIFVKRNGYWPNFKSPKTYNEKVNYRKNNAKHELFSVCADKIAAKKWVAELIGEKHVIPNYFVGDSITPEQIKKVLTDNGDCLLKANHNSGTVYLLTRNSPDSEIEAACKDVNRQLSVDFSKLTNEPWYGDIVPAVLVEKRLQPEKDESDVRDYRFFVFNNAGGTEIILSVYFNARTNLTASFFDEQLNWLPFSIRHPTINVSLDRPKNYDLMIELAKKLAAPFSHARIDFYNVDGQIYFGEITFAHTSGVGEFTNYRYDLWMGNLWQGDPSY